MREEERNPAMGGAWHEMRGKKGGEEEGGWSDGKIKKGMRERRIRKERRKKGVRNERRAVEEDVMLLLHPSRLPQQGFPSRMLSPLPSFLLLPPWRLRAAASSCVLPAASARASAMRGGFPCSA